MTNLTRRNLLAGTAGATVAALLPFDTSVKAATPPAGRQAPGWYRYKIGTIEITVATDGVARFKMAEDHVTNIKLDAVNAALAEVVVDAARLGLDPGSADVLERYQRWRRFDTMAMGVATDGLNRLFSNRSDLLRLVRDVGLGLVDRVPALKRLFIREAAGLVGDVPKLLRGEAL